MISNWYCNETSVLMPVPCNIDRLWCYTRFNFLGTSRGNDRMVLLNLSNIFWLNSVGEKNNVIARWAVGSAGHGYDNKSGPKKKKTGRRQNIRSMTRIRLRGCSDILPPFFSALVCTVAKGWKRLSPYAWRMRATFLIRRIQRHRGNRTQALSASPTFGRF